MKNSIRRRTFGYIAAGMLVIILAFAFLFYSYFYNVFRERMEEDQSRTVASAAERFGTVLTNIRQNAYYLCGNDTLASYLVNKEGISMVKQWDQIGITFSINTGAPNTPLMQSAHAMLLIDPQFPLSHFIQGGFAIKAGGWKRVYSALDVEEEDWYQKTLRLQGQIYAFHTPDDTTDVFFSQFLRSTRIADPRYNENMGVVLYAVPERRLMSILNGARMTDGAIGMVMFDDEPFLSTDTLNFPARGVRAHGSRC